jgi:hypothetical protein
MNVQALLDNSHVLKLYGAFEDDTFIYMVQQLADKGDIYKAYLAQRIRLNEKDLVSKIIQPLLKAIDHTHERGVIHRCGRYHICFSMPLLESCGLQACRRTSCHARGAYKAIHIIAVEALFACSCARA